MSVLRYLHYRYAVHLMWIIMPYQRKVRPANLQNFMIYVLLRRLQNYFLFFILNIFLKNILRFNTNVDYD